MHGIQRKLLELSKRTGLHHLSLREIGKLVGLDYKPQLVKHHLHQLIKKGLLNSEYKSAEIISGDRAKVLSVPILGSANCGEPTRLAEENLEGYLKVSPNLLPTNRTGDLFALKAIGDSMNKAQINSGTPIEDGDLVIIDKGYKVPRNGDYVVSIIDGSANIKRLILDQRNKAAHLISESLTDYPPIVVHAEDDFMINGKVIYVIKKLGGNRIKMEARLPQKQSEHDSVVEASAATYRKNPENVVHTNPGGEKNFSVNQDSYPDIVITDRIGNLVATEEIETEDSVVEGEVSQWEKYANFGVRFNLVVPAAEMNAATNLTRNIKNINVQGYSIENGEIRF